ncbi:MAG: hypothetical protein K2K89_03510 [Ruminococcus sp.]|nr:hypothetical protein [Ruminococcus sp.]
MKLFKNLLSFIATVALTVNVVSPDTSVAINTSIRISEVPAKYVRSAHKNYFDDINSVSDYVRENMTIRNENIEFSVPPDFDGRETVGFVLRNSTTETKKSNQGDYLRKSINYVEYSIIPTDDDITIILNVNYNTTAQQEKLVEEKIIEILNELNIEKKNDYYKISEIYNYIINNVRYATYSTDDLKYTAYGALYNGEAVCQGIASLFYRMAKEAGVSCRMIVGYAGEPHAWNITSIDGVYYLLDPTFDLYFNKVSDCKYFLCGADDFDDYNKKITHIAASSEMELSNLDFDYESESFKADYPISSEKFTFRNNGDANADGHTDAIDASMILSAYAELSTNGKSNFSTVQELTADVNNDKEINSVDASMILQYYAYISTAQAEEHIKPENFFKQEVI